MTPMTRQKEYMGQRYIHLCVIHNLSYKRMPFGRLTDVYVQQSVQALTMWFKKNLVQTPTSLYTFVHAIAASGLRLEE